MGWSKVVGQRKWLAMGPDNRFLGVEGGRGDGLEKQRDGTMGLHLWMPVAKNPGRQKRHKTPIRALPSGVLDQRVRSKPQH
jgi:hypothetical protein